MRGPIGMLAIGIWGTGMTLLGCCATPQPKPLVRVCNATVGDHFDAEDYGWVQPCDRPDGVAGVPGDLSGCSSVCRRPLDDCEADQAAFRDLRLNEGQLQAVADRMKKDCPEGR